MRGSLVVTCHNQTLMGQTSKNGIAREKVKSLVNLESYEKGPRLITDFFLIHSQVKMMKSMRQHLHLRKSYMLLLLNSHLETMSQRP